MASENSPEFFRENLLPYRSSARLLVHVADSLRFYLVFQFRKHLVINPAIREALVFL